MQEGKPRLYFDRPLGLVLIAVYKAAWGLTEIVAAFLLPSLRRRAVSELLEEPTNGLVIRVLEHLNVSDASLKHGIILFVALGITNVCIAAAAWYRSWRIRDMLLAFFIVVASLGVLRFTTHPSVLLVVGLAADLLIIWYLWLVLPKYLPIRITASR